MGEIFIATLVERVDDGRRVQLHLNDWGFLLVANIIVSVWEWDNMLRPSERLELSVHISHLSHQLKHFGPLAHEKHLGRL